MKSDDLFSCRLVTTPTFPRRLTSVLSKFSPQFFFTLVSPSWMVSHGAVCPPLVTPLNPPKRGPSVLFLSTTPRRICWRFLSVSWPHRIWDHSRSPLDPWLGRTFLPLSDRASLECDDAVTYSTARAIFDDRSLNQLSSVMYNILPALTRKSPWLQQFCNYSVDLTSFVVWLVDLSHAEVSGL